MELEDGLAEEEEDAEEANAPINWSFFLGMEIAGEAMASLEL